MGFNPVWWVPVFCLAPAHLFAQEAVEDIRDVKGLVEMPKPPNYFLWVALIVCALLLAFGIWKLLSRQRKLVEISAADRALEKLSECKVLAVEDSPEPLVLAVTGAVRTYIEERFGIAAPRRTTEEFLRDVNAGPDPGIKPFREDLGRFLHLCDGVKFGQSGMESEPRRDLIKGARRFIEATRVPQSETRNSKSAT